MSERRPTWLSLFRELLDSLPGARGRFALATFLAVLSSGASVALMGVSAWLLSRAAEHPPVLYLEAAAVGVRFFGILRGVARYGERLVGHRLALDLQGALRLRAYDHLSQTTLLGSRRGDLLTRLVADVEAIQDVVVRVAIPALSAGLVVTGTSLMLAMFSPRQASVLFATAILAGLVLPWFAQRLSRAADVEAVVARADLAVSTDALAHAAADLVAYGRADAALARHDAVQARLAAADRRAAWTRGLVEGGQMLASGLAVIASLWIGAQVVADGQMLGRDLAVLVLTPLAMHEVLGTLTQAAQTLTRARTSIDRVQAVLDEPPVGRGDRPETAPTTSPRLRLDDVTIGWPGVEPLASGICLDVGPGERLAIVGPSGVGKTTLAATVMGLLPPVSGTVEIDGEVAYLAQDAHIFATTLAENVRIGFREATDGDVTEAMHRAGLALDPARVVGEQGATLSGGEARRVALARVLVGGGKAGRVLLFDEPTEHLDAQTADALMKDVWASSADSPVVVATHDPEVIAACARVLRLDDHRHRER